MKSLSRVGSATPQTDYSLPGSSVHGSFQAGVLEWFALGLISVVALQGVMKMSEMVLGRAQYQA